MSQKDYQQFEFSNFLQSAFFFFTTNAPHHVHFHQNNCILLSHGFCSGKSLNLKRAQGGCFHVFGTFSEFRKHLNTKHTEQIEHEAVADDSADSGFVAFSTSSQHFVEAASGSQVLPVSSVCTRDVYICYCTASGRWCKPIYFRSFCIFHGINSTGDTEAS